MLGTIFNLDLLSANTRRQKSEEIFFQSAGATGAQKTDGAGESSHLALRNYQIRQEIKDSNGEWANRLTKEELNEIQKSLHNYMTKLGYEECLKYSL
ncbi:hypothetical protein GCM10007053_18330 [Halioglobus pacificus]|uniref:Uncharacterized protein n=1 Tax=Parahalioglobus pacificus TaxID=930806 RepID=A0A918XIZ2_9GAMM|nr:hypothetical protein GCM10007053_18330 [Halioglobus pacificus]